MSVRSVFGSHTRAACLAAVIPVAVAIALLTGGCPSPPQDQDNVVVETDRSVSKTIGPAGGELSCTADDGTVYTLIIPPDALSFPAVITMAPIDRIRNLPLSGGLAGAVDLKPSGLLFGRPATLEVDTAAEPGAGQLVLGFSFEGDADEFGLGFAGDNDGVLRLVVPHFSGAGIGFGTLQDVAGFTPSGIPDEDLVNRMLTLNAGPGTEAQQTALLEELFTEIILPQIQNASTDAELRDAVSDYVLWLNTFSIALGWTVIPETSPAFEDERQQAAAAAAPQLRAAIAANNELGAQNESLSALANVLFWQTQASLFGVDTVAERLDRARILAELCAHVVVEAVTLPDPLQVGFPNSFDIRYGLQFVGHPEAQGVPFKVDLTATGATLQNPTGFTAIDGLYTTVITATQDGGVLVESTACLVLPGTTVPTDVCRTDVFSASGLDLSGTWTGPFSVFFGNGQQLATEVTVVLDQNQNAITGTYQVLNDPSHFGTVSATLSGVSLLGFTLTQQSGCPGSFSGTATVSILPGGQQQIAATFSGSDCHNVHPGGQSTLTRQTLRRR